MTGCLSWALRGYRPLIKTANLEAELPEEEAAAAAVFSLSGLDGESAAVVCLIISAVPVIVTPLVITTVKLIRLCGSV